MSDKTKYRSLLEGGVIKKGGEYFDDWDDCWKPVSVSVGRAYEADTDWRGTRMRRPINK